MAASNRRRDRADRLDDWGRNGEESWFDRWQAGAPAVARQQFPTRDDDDRCSVRSDTTSLLGIDPQDSGSLAGLTNGSSLSTISLATALGERNLAHTTRLLEDDGHGGLQVPPLRAVTVQSYECPFDLLPCLRSFGSFDEWYSHSLSHFDGCPPPRLSCCCFCDARFNSPSGEHSWIERMEHVELHHKLGHRLSHARPDMELYRYLWSQGKISEHVFKDLTQGGRRGPRSQTQYPSPPSSPRISTHPSEEPYIITHNPRRERRGGLGRRA